MLGRITADNHHHFYTVPPSSPLIFSPAQISKGDHDKLFLIPNILLHGGLKKNARQRKWHY